VPEVFASVSQGAALVAVHAHVLCDAAIATVPLPPEDANVCVVPFTVKVHGGAPACVTVNVWPAIVTVPARSVVPGFAAMSSRTAPFPLPLAPDPTVIHDAFAVAVHEQPAPATTETLAEAAVAATLALVDDNVKVHGGGGGGAGGGPGDGSGGGPVGGCGDGDGAGGATPACVTATDCPAT